MADTNSDKSFIPGLNRPPERLKEKMGAEGYMDHTPFFDALEKYSRPRLKKGIETYYPVGPDFRR